MSTSFSKSVLHLGVGWQRWTLAALPLLAAGEQVNAQPASGMTSTQRALIAETLCCLRTSLALYQVDRTGEANGRWSAAMPERIESLQRAVDTLARGGVWLWCRQPEGMPRLDLLFLRVNC